MNLGRYLAICGDGIFTMQSVLAAEVPEIGHDGTLSFAAVHIDGQYLAEVHAGQSLRLTTAVLKLGTKSATFEKRILRGPEDEPVFLGQLTSALLDRQTRRAVPLPPHLREALGALRKEA